MEVLREFSKKFVLIIVNHIMKFIFMSLMSYSYIFKIKFYIIKLIFKTVNHSKRKEIIFI